MYALSSIKAGAMGYVGKLAPIKTVRTAIMQVNKGGIYLNKELSSMLAKNENTSNNIAYRYKRLSSRETEVLNMLSSGKRNKDIAQMLDINEKTVSTYKTRLLRKLDASSLAELIQQARLLQTSDL
jgi:DNA-binding NarL/FixJ family response regulator